MKCVCAVIFDDNGHVLLVYNSKRRGWEFPGGAIEEGEEPEDAIKREVLEETGITVKHAHYVGKNDCFLFTFVHHKSSKDDVFNDCVRFFKKLPDNLAFSKDEYNNAISRAFNLLKALGYTLPDSYEPS